MYPGINFLGCVLEGYINCHAYKSTHNILNCKSIYIIKFNDNNFFFPYWTLLLQEEIIAALKTHLAIPESLALGPLLK